MGAELEICGEVLAVSQSRSHNFSKKNQLGIRLLAGIGVEGDAHSGVTVKNRSRLAISPALPNLRQVHLMHSELFDELREKEVLMLTKAVADLTELLQARQGASG